MSCYTIGKERIVFGVCDALGFDKIYQNPKKQTVMKQIGLSQERLGMFSEDKGAPLHMCRMELIGVTFPYFQPSFTKIAQYLEKVNASLGDPEEQFSKVCAILPTGWADSSNYNRKNACQISPDGNIQVSLVPYSEHSNFSELKEFCDFLKPIRIVPTVYKDKNDYKNIEKRFRHCVDMKKAQERFFGGVACKPAPLKKTEAAVTTPPPKPILILSEEDEEQEMVETETEAMVVVEVEEKKVIAVETEKQVESWVCTKCTLINEITNSKCQVCGASSGNRAVQPPKRKSSARSPARQPLQKKKKGQDAQSSSNHTMFAFFKRKDDPVSFASPVSRDETNQHAEPAAPPRPQGQQQLKTIEISSPESTAQKTRASPKMVEEADEEEERENGEGESLRKLFATPKDPNALPQDPWVLGALDIRGVAVTVDDDRPEITDITFALNTKLKNLPLAQTASALGSEPQSIIVWNLEIPRNAQPRNLQLHFFSENTSRSPYDEGCADKGAR
jgi:hypothetical protein